MSGDTLRIIMNCKLQLLYRQLRISVSKNQEAGKRIVILSALIGPYLQQKVELLLQMRASRNMV